MKNIALILMLIITVSILGCNEVKKEEQEKTTVSKIDENIEDSKEFYVRIKTIGSKRFFNGKVEFQPELEGDSKKDLQYKWSIEYTVDNGEDLVDGLVGEDGPVREIINNGEAVYFGVYAEVNYEADAYSERKLKLEVLDKDNGDVLAEDIVIIENHQGYYIVEGTRDEKLSARVLKTSKAELYGKIIDSLWDIDSALNSGVSYINVDTSTFKEFNGDDKEELFEYLKKQYDVEVLDMTMKELEDAGYIKEMSFVDGISFSIDKYIVNSENKVSFEGRKWASGIGAIGFIIEAEHKNGQWEIMRCDMTWIS